MKKWFQCAVVMVILALMILQPAQIAAVTVVDEDKYCETVEEAAAILRQQMQRREMVISIPVVTRGDISALAHEIFQEALVHTGEPTAGDYLAHQHGGARISITGRQVGDTYYLTYTYYMNFYYSSAEEERELDAETAELLKELELEDATDYEKVQAIYGWITENVVYDYDHLNDEDYWRKYSAYAAMMDGTSVCQGYTLLLYRLLLAAGVDCRIITGDAGGRHAWNIVKLDGQYYNVDATWDAIYDQAGLDYAYFLKSPASFDTEHTRDAKYETAEFHAMYPMSEVDYSDVGWLKWGEVLTISGITGVTVEELLYATGYDGLVITEDGKLLDADDIVGTGMVFLATGYGPSLEWPIVVAGDTNGDGRTTVTDLLALRAHLVDRTRLEDLVAKAADMNGNGMITVTDLLMIKERILGMDSD